MGNMSHDPIGQVVQSEYAKVVIVPFSKLFLSTTIHEYEMKKMVQILESTITPLIEFKGE
jgi:hypothetical protein